MALVKSFSMLLLLPLYESRCMTQFQLPYLCFWFMYMILGPILNHLFIDISFLYGIKKKKEQRYVVSLVFVECNSCTVWYVV